MKIIHKILEFVTASENKIVDLNQIESIDKFNLYFNISLLKQEKYIVEDPKNQPLVCMTWKGFDLLDSIREKQQALSKQYWPG